MSYLGKPGKPGGCESCGSACGCHKCRAKLPSGGMAGLGERYQREEEEGVSGWGFAYAAAPRGRRVVRRRRWFAVGSTPAGRSISFAPTAARRAGRENSGRRPCGTRAGTGLSTRAHTGGHTSSIPTERVRAAGVCATRTGPCGRAAARRRNFRLVWRRYTAAAGDRARARDPHRQGARTATCGTARGCRGGWRSPERLRISIARSPGRAATETLRPDALRHLGETLVAMPPTDRHARLFHA